MLRFELGLLAAELLAVQVQVLLLVLEQRAGLLQIVLRPLPIAERDQLIESSSSCFDQSSGTPVVSVRLRV